jgi:ABC transport system ATP-binding/permease protein
MSARATIADRVPDPVPTNSIAALDILLFVQPRPPSPAELEQDRTPRPAANLRAINETISARAEHSNETPSPPSAPVQSPEPVAAGETQVRELSMQLQRQQADVEALRAELQRTTQALAARDQRIATLETHNESPIARGTVSIAAAPVAQARYLRCLGGPTEVSHEISKARTSIGRTDDNDIAIDAKFVSRRHALVLTGPKYTLLEDLGSTNGVFVNQERVTTRVLLHGDCVTIGQTTFRFEIVKLGGEIDTTGV